MITEQINIGQLILGLVATIAVFIVLIYTIHFHKKKQNFSKDTIALMKWLIKVLVIMFLAVSFGGVSFLKILSL